MSDWKNTEWQEKLKHKPTRCWIRDEIEEIIKEENIDRTRFYEYSKTEYKNVINRFYYAFADYEKHPNVQLSYCWLHFRENLKCSEIIRETNCEWLDFLRKIQDMFFENDDEKYYMILSEGWVYEGYIDTIIKVLSETDGLLEDFYIVSRQFDWMVAYCSDGECAIKIGEQK